MKKSDLITEILATYQKHGWLLRRILLMPETRAELENPDQSIFGGASIEEAAIDAIWFSRPSYGNREAWELRLIAETQYALFETFDVEESEEDREKRREMESRLQDYVVGDK